MSGWLYLRYSLLNTMYPPYQFPNFSVEYGGRIFEIVSTWIVIGPCSVRQGACQPFAKRSVFSVVTYRAHYLYSRKNEL